MQDQSNRDQSVATFGDVRTQVKVPAKADHAYIATVKARSCKSDARELSSSARYSRHLQQETAAVFSAGWAIGHCKCWSGGEVRKSTRAGMTAHFAGRFKSLGLITDHGTNRGAADVFLDGVKIGSLNDYAPKHSTPMQVDYLVQPSMGGLHTVLVKVTSGRIDIDAFVTSGE